MKKIFLFKYESCMCECVSPGRRRAASETGQPASERGRASQLRSELCDVHTHTLACSLSRHTTSVPKCRQRNLCSELVGPATVPRDAAKAKARVAALERLIVTKVLEYMPGNGSVRV